MWHLPDYCWLSLNVYIFFVFVVIFFFIFDSYGAYHHHIGCACDEYRFLFCFPCKNYSWKTCSFYFFIFFLSLVESTVRRHRFYYFVSVCVFVRFFVFVVGHLNNNCVFINNVIYISSDWKKIPTVFLWRLTLCVLKLDACWHCFTYRKIVAKLAHTHLVYHISKLICFCLSWLEIDFAVPFQHPLKSLTPNKAFTTCQFWRMHSGV